MTKNISDTKTAETTSRATESADVKLCKSIDTFSSNPQLLLPEKIYMIAVTKNEVSTSYLIITDQNKTFAIYTPGSWQDPDTKKTVGVRRKNKFKSN